MSNIQNPEFETAFEINYWPVLVNERAASGGESAFVEKYGEYAVLTIIWIEGNQYFVNSPTLTISQVSALVESMTQVNSL